jgi:predicted Zn-dependent protease
MLNYSRQDEEEADRKGLRYLEAANYSGEDFVKIMRKMGQDSWKAGGHMPTYLTTHPGVSERVVYLSTTVGTRAPSAKVRTEDSEGFILMQVKLYGAYGNPKEAEPKFREWFDKPETRAMAYYGTGLMRRRQRLMDEAVTAFKSAIALRPDLAPILVELGETYFEMGEFDKAQQVLISALTLKPDQPAALYALGRCQLEQGQAAEASKQLEKAIRINNRLPKINYYLGLAYGKNNQLVDAHYHFGGFTTSASAPYAMPNFISRKRCGSLMIPRKRRSSTGSWRRSRERCAPRSKVAVGLDNSSCPTSSRL